MGHPVVVRGEGEEKGGRGEESENIEQIESVQELHNLPQSEEAWKLLDQQFGEVALP